MGLIPSKATAKLSGILADNKIIFELLLAVFMLALAVYFVGHQHLELSKVEDQLLQSNASWVAVGVALVIPYILLQGGMYWYSFRVIHCSIPLIVGIKLFLKRNVVSVFLPAGGLSSLAFFNKEVDPDTVSPFQIYSASAIFAFCAMFSVVLIAFPVLLIAYFQNPPEQTLLWAFVVVLVISAAMFIVGRSLWKRTWASKIVGHRFPSFTLLLNDLSSQSISRKPFLMVLFLSFVVELVGVLFLYIALAALGISTDPLTPFLGYVAMVVLYVASPFLRGLGAIEVAVTLLLTKSGIPLATAASATVLFRLFEFWLPLLIGVLSFISRRDHIVLRVFPAMVVLRLHFVQGLLGNSVIATSNGLVLTMGVLLIILSVFLFMGSRRAWWVALFLASVSLVGHLIKAADYEEAILAFLAAGTLLYIRKSYRFKPSQRSTRISLLTVVAAILLTLIYSTLGFLYANPKAFGHDFNLWGSVKTTLHFFFLFDADYVTAKTPFAKLFLWTLYSGGVLLVGFIAYGLMRPIFYKPFNSDEDWKDARELTHLYGNDVLDYFKTYPDKLLFLSADRQAFLAFKLTRYFACILGEPIGKDTEHIHGVYLEFEAYCKKNGWVNMVHRVSSTSLDFYRSLGKRALPIGEEAIVDLTSFSLQGRKFKPLRNTVNHLEKENLTVSVVAPPQADGLLQKLQEVSREWLSHPKRNEIVFSQGLFDPALLKSQTIITVENPEKRVLAFLNIIDDYTPGEVTYDLIRQSSDAPGGVQDMLIIHAMEHYKNLGYNAMNLGLAPLSGIDDQNLTGRTLRFAYENLRPFDRYKGLRRFKEKYGPTWQKRYLIYENDYQLIQIPGVLRRISNEN